MKIISELKNDLMDTTVLSTAKLIIGIGFIVNTFALANSEPSFHEPWSVCDDSPVIFRNAETNTPTHTRVFKYGERFADSICFVWLKLYQHCFSLLNTAKCPMEPSCSNYSIQAVKKHGAFIGVILTADRLLHEMDEQHYVPLVKKGKSYRYLDPVENNDFWWYK